MHHIAIFTTVLGWYCLFTNWPTPPAYYTITAPWIVQWQDFVRELPWPIAGIFALVNAAYITYRTYRIEENNG